MFVSQEKNVAKKTFQKPNILRRKPKASVPKTQNNTGAKESVGSKPVVVSTVVEDTSAPHTHEAPTTPEHNKQTITTSVYKLTLANNNDEGSNVIKSQETDIDGNVINYTVSNNVIHISSVDKSLEQNSLNIESFINGGGTGQNNLSHSDVMTDEQKTTQSKPKWSFLDNPVDIMISNYNVPQPVISEHSSDFMIDVVPSAIPTAVPQPSKQLHEVICSSMPTRTVSVELISNKAVKFKCDEPNCSKGFWTEERLNKHKLSHGRAGGAAGAGGAGGARGARGALACPVRPRCPRTFPARRDLLRHLDADHEPDDAPHRCEVCGRRFFWASGLRAHAQSVCARGGLACAWPGCGRVFRLPCRLREHARAHTGDRPYLCSYPDCGWAFRSASKLVRHARRHTDERRHACAACGRAFLRREHLRDHAARHHAPHARPTHRCPHAGCEQTFTNMSTLYMHMKKLHRKDEAAAPPAADSVYLVSVDGAGAGPGGGSAGAGEGAGGGACAARTHCTWPLARVAPLASLTSLTAATATYVLEDDAQAECAEGVEGVEGGAGGAVGEGEGGEYSVRSDLFLHSNAPLDDDSQSMGGGGAALGEEPDLPLIDAHPSIDLMQEALMYEDAAVDESSFRVLLMSEDLA